MSEPKRYAIRGFSAALVEEENGVFIRYEDYAILKAETIRQIETAMPPVEAYIAELEAENARLKENEVFYKANIYEMGRRIDGLKEDLEIERSYIARLRAEVGQLTKAGDATSQRLHWFCQKWGWKDDDLKTLTPEWEAAKEGKQS